MGVRMRLTNDAINSDVRLLMRRENPARLLASGSQPLRRPASGERGRRNAKVCRALRSEALE